MKRIAPLSIAAGLALAACNAGAFRLATSDIPLTPAAPDAEVLDLAEAQWLAAGVRDYRIQVQSVSLWHLQTHEIVVEDGAVSESSATCIPAPLEFDGTCRVDAFEAAGFTVPGLFAKARSLDGKKWASVSFDPGYYFPNSVGFNDPEIYDEEWRWHVVKFEAGQ